MRAEIQKSAPFKDLLKSWLLDENAHKYLVFLRPKFLPDFLFSLASLDSFPPGGSHWVLPHQRVYRQSEETIVGIASCFLLVVIGTGDITLPEPEH